MSTKTDKLVADLKSLAPAERMQVIADAQQQILDEARSQAVSALDLAEANLRVAKLATHADRVLALRQELTA